ncbi:Phosphatidylserine decarboxylase proenzyme [bioreactor metagenome]|jgi:phosphatidylserine decarboxylase precursor-related protein|uniref:Phosphatidylserine decarboxylase proenzyme n=1 Tax=bioreactor metagenome TaxID=1076179 RepID=A0A644TJ39_9ZZZZ|nr:phosphatidylserine decarboxylase family protein [Acidaminococcaceae bacterium]NLU44938.1 phosphatidylserine decarboxylase family protein [Acholeplasmataceae bacterium]
MEKIEIVKDGYRIILGFLIITLAVFYFWGIDAAIVPALLSCFFIYFFRNPNRPLPTDDSILYSPADGTVMNIEEFFDDEYLNEEAKKVTIFLSVFNVHVNRAPMSGEIKYQRYTCGGYLPAYKDSASFVNERHAIGLDNGKNRILVIQIAGLLARRIVSWVTLGKNIKQGECYGMIKFGSSTELVMPKTVEVLVKKGDKVKGGLTIIGRQIS